MANDLAVNVVAPAAAGGDYYANDYTDNQHRGK
jgi:hypothetical protein